MKQYSSAMSIPACQLQYIWNELQFTSGGHACDPEREARRHRLLILDLDMG